MSTAADKAQDLPVVHNLQKRLGCSRIQATPFPTPTIPKMVATNLLSKRCHRYCEDPSAGTVPECHRKEASSSGLTSYMIISCLDENEQPFVAEHENCCRIRFDYVVWCKEPDSVDMKGGSLLARDTSNRRKAGIRKDDINDDDNVLNWRPSDDSRREYNHEEREDRDLGQQQDCEELRDACRLGFVRFEAAFSE